MSLKRRGPMLVLPYEEAMGGVEWVDRGAPGPVSSACSSSTASRVASATSARSSQRNAALPQAIASPRRVNALPLRTLEEAHESLQRRRAQEVPMQREMQPAAARVPFPTRLWTPRQLCQKDHERRELKGNAAENGDAEEVEEESPCVPLALDKDELAELVERLTKQQRTECADKSSCTLPSILDKPVPEGERRVAQAEAVERLAAPKKAPEPPNLFTVPPLDAGDVDAMIDRLHKPNNSPQRCSRHEGTPAASPPSGRKPIKIKGSPRPAAPSSPAAVTKRLYDLGFYEKRNRHGHFQGDGYEPMPNKDFMLLPRPPAWPL